MDHTATISPIPPPPYSNPPTNPLPIVIPQIATSWQGPFTSPFARAYPPSLQSTHSISPTQFLQFIDGFNAVFVANPALQLANMAGMVMGQVHGLAPVQIAGAALSAASGLGSAAVSIVRARTYMRGANEGMWHPAGLHARVLTTKKLLAEIGYPGDRVRLLSVGREEEEEEERGVEPVVAGRAALMRRQEALAGYVQGLRFDVGPSTESENLLRRMGDWQAGRLAAKQQKKLDKDRREDEMKWRENGREVEKEQRKMEKEVAKLERELEKERAKADRKMAKDGHKPHEAQRIENEFRKEQMKIEKEMEKKIREGEKEVRRQAAEGDHELGKTDRKEEKTANKVRWIVITRWVPETAGDELEDDDSSESA